MGDTEVTCEAAGRLRVVLTGQSLIKRPVKNSGEFDEIQAAVKWGDVRFTNFEGTIRGTYGGGPTKVGYVSASESNVLDELKWIGFNLLSLSNNHAYDWGAGGVMSTLEEVSQRGFAYAGLGQDLTTARQPGRLRTDQGEVILVAADCGPQPDEVYALDADGEAHAKPGLNPLRVRWHDGTRAPDEADAQAMLNTVAEARQNARLVIVYLHNHHWEEPMESTPEWIRSFAKQLLGAGASAVVMHGTPSMQGIELHDGHPIFYSLGNFIFHSANPARWMGEVGFRAWQSVVAMCEFNPDGTVEEIRLLPIALGHRQVDLANPAHSFDDAPRPAAPDYRREIIEALASRSSKLGTTIEYQNGLGRVVT